MNKFSSLAYEEIDHVYRLSILNRFYEDSVLAIGVVDNIVLVENKYTNEAYLLHCETKEKASETANLISELLQITGMSINKLMRKLGIPKGMLIEDISMTFYIFREKAGEKE